MNPASQASTNSIALTHTKLMEISAISDVLFPLHRWERIKVRVSLQMQIIYLAPSSQPSPTMGEDKFSSPAASC